MMTRIKRKIVYINQQKCDGCGLCVPACHEGALRIVDGKARIVKEDFCDGLGACIGKCPRGALSIEEREVEEYDEDGVNAHINANVNQKLSCPSTEMSDWTAGYVPESGDNGESGKSGTASELRQWPIQLNLVPVNAPYLQNADLIMVADCVPFAYPDFHRDFLKGKVIVIGCPKLDDAGVYAKKILQIIKHSGIKSLMVIHMEVPCCHALARIAQEAINKQGRDIPFKRAVIGVRGERIPTHQL